MREIRKGAPEQDAVAMVSRDARIGTARRRGRGCRGARAVSPSRSAPCCMTMITGNPAYDAAGSIGVGVLLMVVAYVVAREVKSMIVGESASPEVRRAIDAHLARAARDSAHHQPDHAAMGQACRGRRAGGDDRLRERPRDDRCDQRRSRTICSVRSRKCAGCSSNPISRAIAASRRQMYELVTQVLQAGTDVLAVSAACYRTSRVVQDRVLSIVDRAPR